jgi:hypothetical protein
MLDTAFLVALVIALVEVLKRVGVCTRWLPLIALALGVILNVAVKFVGVEAWDLIIGGIVVGLSSCGVWDISKKTIFGK